MILLNGNIRTQDAKRPSAEAVRLHGSKIVQVGSNDAVKAAAGRREEIIDLKGKLVLPGLIDSHFHFYEMARNYGSVDLSTVFSFNEMEKAVAAKAAQSRSGEWVLGYGFNESDWPENRMPDKTDLDRVSPENPVCIWRSDLHLGVANSSALKAAGIDSATPDPEGGTIARDGAGNPTGVLREIALNLIKEAVPAKSEADILENMERGMQDLHALGLTAVHDIRLMGGEDGAASLKAWQRLYEENRLHLRCHVSLPGEMTEEAVGLGLRTGFGNDKLRLGHLKFFSDGGMGARTAWMIEKYLDAEYGIPATSVEEIEAAAMKADKAGLRLLVHAVGDRANREMIAMFERVEKAGQGKKGRKHAIPHRIDHVQMVRPEDLDRMAALNNVIASCQPNNLSIDISMIDMCAGEKGKYAYALRRILDRHIPLVLSSDAPVSNPNPLAGIYSAVTRKRMDRTPEQGWYPDQALRVEEAVSGYTLSAATAAGQQDIFGSIAEGKFADMAVFETDIFSIPAEEIADVRVDMTLFDGEVVYERKKGERN